MTQTQIVLLTGSPGVGKTTAVTAVLRMLAERSVRARGFVTDEVREGGERVGFQLRTLEGMTETLARVGLRSRYHVGRYGVDVAGLQRIVHATLDPDPGDGDVELYVVDEIGKMECCAPEFVAGMARVLDSGKPVLATVSQRGGGLIGEVKRRDDAELWEVTRDNRDEVPSRVLRWLETLQ